MTNLCPICKENSMPIGSTECWGCHGVQQSSQEDHERDITTEEFDAHCKKLSRERIATAAMQGMLANPDFTLQLYNYEARAKMAILCADTLIAELER